MHDLLQVKIESLLAQVLIERHTLMKEDTISNQQGNKKLQKKKQKNKQKKLL